MRRIDNIVVHCTATSPNATVQSITDYHLKTLGWQVAGYHFLIGADGTVVPVVREEQASNGVRGYNANSIHVCYIGGLNGEDTRTPVQKRALVSVLTLLKAKYPKARILGHRDIASTDSNHNGIIDPWERVKACPCFDAIKEYKNI